MADDVFELAKTNLDGLGVHGVHRPKNRTFTPPLLYLSCSASNRELPRSPAQHRFYRDLEFHARSMCNRRFLTISQTILASQFKILLFCASSLDSSVGN